MLILLSLDGGSACSGISNQSMLLAHTINQFVEKSTGVAELLAAHSKETIANLWKRLLAYFSENKIKRGEYEKLLVKRYQVRLE